MSASVLFEERSAQNGVRYGIATLNAPQTLNSLTLEMSKALTQQFDLWSNDPGLAFVILTAVGDRAFCAGGDLQSLYHSILQTDSRIPGANTYAAEFFEVESRLDYQIHQFPKPVVCWADGYVM